MPITTVPITHHEASVNGVRLHYAEAGEGPLVVCLHGFPEFWYSWRHQLDALSAAGFRVVAPDMRGYNKSSKPTGWDSYRLEALVEDVAALIAHLGDAPAVVLGHDWGGMIAWTLAAHRPASVRAVVALNAPHPRAWRAGVRNPLQAMRSWYMLLFQIPWLPEALARRDDFALADRMLKDVVHRDGFTADDVARYKQAIAQPGALTAAINYYRAMRHRASRRMLFAPLAIDAPAMLIWGDRDRYLRAQLADASRRWVPQLRVEHVDASHWVQNDVPGEVNALLLDFFRRLE